MINLPVAIVIVLVESFLLGSIPFGYIVGKVGYGRDPRDGGSHSIGMTNINRLFGAKAAAVTFACDVGKGALASGIAHAVLGVTLCSGAIAHDAVLVCAVLGAVLGHVYCPWLGFKGGKGVSVGFGSVLAAFPVVCLCICIFFAIFALATKTISAGSIAAAVTFPVFCCILHWGSWVLIAVSIVAAVAVVYAHRGNIRRLMNGTEPKFTVNTHDGPKDGGGSSEGSDETGEGSGQESGGSAEAEA